MTHPASPEHQIEPELRRGPPRNVKSGTRYTGSAFLIGIFWIPFQLAGIYLAYQLVVHEILAMHWMHSIVAREHLRTGVLVAVAWNSMCALLLWLATEPNRHRKLAMSGIPVVGTVSEIMTQTTTRSFSADKKYFWVQYQFVPQDATTSKPRSVSGSTQVPEADASTLKPGMPLTVLYDPARPRRNIAYRFAAYQAE